MDRFTAEVCVLALPVPRDTDFSIIEGNCYWAHSRRGMVKNCGLITTCHKLVLHTRAESPEMYISESK